MSVNAKPLDFIICEGPSDAEFVCLYIERKCGYFENRTEANRYSSTINNAKFFYECGQNRDALIIAAGGCHNINRLESITPLIISLSHHS